MKKASMLLYFNLPKTMQYKFKATTQYNEVSYKQKHKDNKKKRYIQQYDRNEKYIIAKRNKNQVSNKWSNLPT